MWTFNCKNRHQQSYDFWVGDFLHCTPDVIFHWERGCTKAQLMTTSFEVSTGVNYGGHHSIRSRWTPCVHELISAIAMWMISTQPSVHCAAAEYYFNKCVIKKTLYNLLVSCHSVTKCLQNGNKWTYRNTLRWIISLIIAHVWPYNEAYLY